MISAGIPPPRREPLAEGSLSAKVRVGSRGSKLALVQVNEAQALLEEKGIGISFDRKTYSTRGDKDKTVSLTTSPADNFFTDTLDEALLAGDIDVAVHSAKDLPQKLRDGLAVFALTRSLDETDAFIGKTTFDRLPAGSKVATSSILRQQQIKALNPQLQTVDIRGTIEERIRKMEDGYCDGLIAATMALKRLGLEKYIQNIMPWEAAPLQGQLAIVGRQGQAALVEPRRGETSPGLDEAIGRGGPSAGRATDTALRELFAAIDARRGYGRVFLVGAGPGDPELITMKGVAALRSAGCVFYDYLIPAQLLDHAPNAEKIYAGKRKGSHAMPQEELNRLIRQKAMAGKTVVRLKGGDPLVFGRGADEIEYLRGYHIQVEVIPGISSAVGIPSRLGIPLTARGVAATVAFISGYKHEEDEQNPIPLDIPQADTLVFLMGLTKLDKIVESLDAKRWSKQTPVMVISKGTCPREKIISGTLADIQQRIKENPLEPPVLIIVGETLRFYHENSDALRRARILYTGTAPERFGEMGEIIAFPTIQIVPARLPETQIKTLLADLPGYDIILFTSRFAVKYFCDLLQENGYPVTNLNSKTVVAIGEETARGLKEQGIDNGVMAETETSQGLFKEMAAKLDLRGKKILFPRSSLPNPYLKERLVEEGSQVDELTIYQNIKPAKRPLPETGIDKILFTSPSTVRNFTEDYGKIPAGWRILSRGPLTSACLREMGYTDFEELRDTH